MKGRLTQFSHILSPLTFKSAIMLAFTAVVVASLAFDVEQLTANNDSSACACNSETRYNNSLPSSHPNNRCAEQAQALSWTSWLTGMNRSSQFHFVDLLELLHGHQDKPVDDMKPSHSKQSY